MSSESQFEKAANEAAEEVLRVIYGDDLVGCNVSMDSVAAVVRGVLEEQAQSEKMVSELYEKGLEAIQLLSTPPVEGQALEPEALRSLLADRLDTIRTLAGRIIETTAAAR